MSESERYDAYMAERGFRKFWFGQNGLACFEYARVEPYYAENEHEVRRAARNCRASRVKKAEELPKPKRKRGSF